PLGAVGMSILIGGDAFARHLFWGGIAILCACNVLLFWMTGKADRYQPGPVGVLWILSTVGVQPAVYYFGPYSAVVMVDMLGIVFIALGRVRWTARATAIVCIGGHALIATPMIIGWIKDVGVLPSVVTARDQLIIAEILVVG